MLGQNFTGKKLQTINRRMFIIGVAKVVIFTGIITRLFSLQERADSTTLCICCKREK